MNSLFIFYFLFLLSSTHASHRNILETTPGSLEMQDRNRMENNETQPPSILLTCIWSRKFQIPTLNGNVFVTCLNSQSEIDITLARITAAKNCSNDALPLLQRKGRSLLAMKSFVAVCSLQCDRGRPLRRNRLLFDSDIGEPDDINVGCHDYSKMKCEENEISLKSLSACKKIPYNRRVPCSDADSELDCFRRHCCWDNRIKKYALNEKYRCYKSKNSLSQTSALFNLFSYFARRQSKVSAMADAVQSVIAYHRSRKYHTTRRISPKNPARCGCKSKQNEHTRCNKVIRSRDNDPVRLVSANLSALKRLFAPNKRVSGGRNVKENEWPWQAMIYFNSYLCGGTLISDRYVVTAAHCVTMQNGSLASDGLIFLGVTNISDPNRGNQQTRRAAKVVRHENFSLASNMFPRNDLALIELDRKVDLDGKAVQPLCLPGTRIPRNSDQCFVTGFGRMSGYGRAAQVLQQACVPLVSMMKCQTYYGTGVLSSQNICAGSEKPNSADTCSGDSGGPLVCRRSTEFGSCGWYLAGVTSFGRSPCGSGSPSVYVNVFRYQSWIYQVIDRLNRRGR